MRNKSWGDFSIGDRMRTLSVTISEAHIIAWAGLTMDFYPIHMDEEYASRTPFKGRVAHGPMIFAMAVGLVGSSGFLGGSVVAWLGAENVRMSAPARAGDTITVTASVVERREISRPDKGIIVFEYEVENQEQRTILQFRNLIMFPRAS